jgi:hypothetical protein
VAAVVGAGVGTLSETVSALHNVTGMLPGDNMPEELEHLSTANLLVNKKPHLFEVRYGQNQNERAGLDRSFDAIGCDAGSPGERRLDLDAVADRFSRVAASLAELFAHDVHIARRIDPQSHRVRANPHNGDGHIVADEDSLTGLPRENEHDTNPFRSRLNGVNTGERACSRPPDHER